MGENEFRENSKQNLSHDRKYDGVSLDYMKTSRGCSDTFCISDINLRHYPVLYSLRNFHFCLSCLIVLFCHNFRCKMNLEIVKFDVTQICIRYCYNWDHRAYMCINKLWLFTTHACQRWISFDWRYRQSLDVHGYYGGAFISDEWS